MNKFTPLAFAAMLATFALVPVAVHAAETSQTVSAGVEASAPAANVVAGKTLYSVTGQRIAAIYRVTKTGQVQVIFDGKMVAIPASTISEVGGKLVTSLTKASLYKTK